MGDELMELRGVVAGLQAWAAKINGIAEAAQKRELALEDKVRIQAGWIADLQSGMYVNCVYCGHRYGPSESTPESKQEILRKHVESCPEHPMSWLRDELTSWKQKFYEHLGTVGRFLSQLHVILVDPLAEENVSIEELMPRLLEAARWDRQAISDLNDRINTSNSRTTDLQVELGKLKQEADLDYRDMREFQAKFMEADQARKDLELRFVEADQARNDLEVRLELEKNTSQTWRTESSCVQEVLAKLRQAVAKHESQRLDDRCWRDDRELYEAAGVPITDNYDQLPPRDEFLGNCARFFECRQDPGLEYIIRKSYARRLDVVAAARHLIEHGPMERSEAWRLGVIDLLARILHKPLNSAGLQGGAAAWELLEREES